MFDLSARDRPVEERSTRSAALVEQGIELIAGDFIICSKMTKRCCNLGGGEFDERLNLPKYTT